jgi:hypothetical protein
VTTEEPAAAGLRKSGALDAAYGIRVCVGGSSSDWLGQAGVGGIAYLASFSFDSDTPAFVFPAELGGPNSIKYILESVRPRARRLAALAAPERAGVQARSLTLPRSPRPQISHEVGHR